MIYVYIVTVSNYPVFAYHNVFQKFHFTEERNYKILTKQIIISHV